MTRHLAGPSGRQSQLNAEREVDRIGIELEAERSEGAARDRRVERLTQRTDGQDAELK